MEKFRSANPDLSAGLLNIQESKANEITANLRPNPDATMVFDQLQFFNGNPYRPFGLALPLVSFDYLHERRHKRELRLESAQEGTAIAESQQQDLERNLLFNLRTAFVQVLEGKALLANAKDNLDYFDKELAINRARFQSGDIARLDLDRIALAARAVRIGCANGDGERADGEDHAADAAERPHSGGPLRCHWSFRVQGTDPATLDDLHSIALDSRPDLRAALQAVEKARTDHKLAVANGSTDPTFSVDFARNPPIPLYIGASVSIPLRIFDRNQGEKARTEIDIAHAERQKESTQAHVFSDVDSAYYLLGEFDEPVAALRRGGRLLWRRRSAFATRCHFPIQRGQANLVDYLDAQREYRATQVAYINLVGAYLNAVSQLNMAVGKEAVQ